MKPAKEAIDRGAQAIILAFSEVEHCVKMTEQCARGLARVVLVAALADAEVLEDGPGSPEHPVGLIPLERE